MGSLNVSDRALAQLVYLVPDRLTACMISQVTVLGHYIEADKKRDRLATSQKNYISGIGEKIVKSDSILNYPGRLFAQKESIVFRFSWPVRSM